MSAPVVAQVDTITGDSDGSGSFFYGESEPGIFSMSFSRTYQHYLQNNMTATGYTESAGGGGIINAWDLDEGWHMVPYWNPGVAMDSGDLAKIAAMGDGIRIDSLGYKIKLAQLFRCDITTHTGVTELSSTFINEPYWETYVDGDHTFEGMPAPLSTPISQAMTVGYTPIYSNNNMKTQEATDFASAELPRVKWHWHRNGLAPHAGWTPDDTLLRKGSSDGPFEIMSTLSESGRQCHATGAMSNYGVSWKNKDKGAWYPFCVPQGDKSIWPTTNSRQGTWPGTFPLRRDNLLTGAAGLDSETGGANIRGTNLPNAKHNRWQKASWDTALPFGSNDLPPDSFIKLQRLHDISSPIRLAGMVLIEYTCRVSVSPSAKLLMSIPFSTSGAASVTHENKVASNQWTQGTLRQWRMWGIPNLPAPTTGSSIITGTVHYPPWTPFTKAGDLDGTPTPFAGFVTDWPNDDNTNGLFYKPPLELATIQFGENTTTNTLFCLTESWDGDPPTTELEVRDSRRVNNVVHPSLMAHRTVSGIPPLVWVLESLVDFEDINTMGYASNPLHAWIGPSTPATNRLHLFADPASNEAMDVSACSLARKRRREEQLREEEGGAE